MIKMEWVIGAVLAAMAAILAYAPVEAQSPLNGQNSQYGSNQNPQTATSGNVAAGVATATIAAPSGNTLGKTAYITGFTIAAGGATAGVCVNATVTGPANTLNYAFCTPTGATVGAAPLSVIFNPAVPASAPNTAIAVSLPSLGAGNTNTTVDATGYYQ